ncbi:hypothetical protein RRG08_022390 [Elysia crispata]|uniref:Uncharacterized protein n=1 Tax=Elysia crispata TaxID=231223 RepID=A0AAE0Z1A7_9GAST|nr:hypothetical protein RRG08_022390 [Elysia crispata]
MLDTMVIWSHWSRTMSESAYLLCWSFLTGLWTQCPPIPGHNGPIQKILFKWWSEGQSHPLLTSGPCRPLAGVGFR